LQKTLPLFDLIVGTEEEFHIAGGATDTIEALRAVRAITPATLVCKRGPMGASAFEGAIPDDLDDGIHGQGFPIEVFNVLGAGDGFMSGLMKGWLDDEDWETALTYANACGAFAVSRHGCTPAYPSWEELQYFLARGVVNPALRQDEALEQIHWSTNRRRTWGDLRIFAFDHRVQLEEMASAAGARKDRIGAFKALCLRAVEQVAEDKDGYGVLCDHRLGSDTLYRATGGKLWVGRPVELPGSRPLQFEPELGEDLGALREWPLDQVVKALCFYHPDDEEALRMEQEASVRRLFTAARRNRLEFLLELIPSKVGPVDETTTASVIRRFYEIGIYPDWWKLEPMQSAASWRKTCSVIEHNDPYTQGVVVLGLDAPVAELEASFRLAAAEPLVKGFAVGRTIFSTAAKQWLAGTISDHTAIKLMASSYQELCRTWDVARVAAGEIA
jgi:5-dehydro-2-deoxygluconokinase